MLLAFISKILDFFKSLFQKKDSLSGIKLLTYRSPGCDSEKEVISDPLEYLKGLSPKEQIKRFKEVSQYQAQIKKQKLQVNLEEYYAEYFLPKVWECSKDGDKVYTIYESELRRRNIRSHEAEKFLKKRGYKIEHSSYFRSQGVAFKVRWA